MVVIGEGDVLKDDVVTLRLEHLRAFRRGRVVDLIQTAGRNLRNEHLRDQGQSLVEGGVDAGDDHEEQEHKVDGALQHQRRAGQDRGGHAEAHDDGRPVDEQADDKFALSVGAFKPVDLPVQTVQVFLLSIRRPNLADVLDGFLDVVRHRQGVGFQLFGAALLDPSAAEEKEERHRHAPQAGEGHAPVVDK